MTQTTHAEALIRTAGRLIELMERELELLRDMDVPAIGALQEEKAMLSLGYQEHLKALAGSPDELGAIAPALRAELAAIATRMDSLVGRNQRAVEAAREAHDRLMSAIVDAVARHDRRHAGYGPARTGTGGKRSASIALTVNRSL